MSKLCTMRSSSYTLDLEIQLNLLNLNWRLSLPSCLQLSLDSVKLLVLCCVYMFLMCLYCNFWLCTALWSTYVEINCDWFVAVVSAKLVLAVVCNPDADKYTWHSDSMSVPNGLLSSQPLINTGQVWCVCDRWSCIHRSFLTVLLRVPGLRLPSQWHFWISEQLLLITEVTILSEKAQILTFPPLNVISNHTVSNNTQVTTYIIKQALSFCYKLSAPRIWFSIKICLLKEVAQRESWEIRWLR